MESHKNDYQLKQGERYYILTTSLLGDTIKIVCKNKSGPSYPKIFTLDEFKSLDKDFYNFKSVYEALEFIDKTLRNQKVGVKEENGGVIITFFINENGLIHQIDIPLGDYIPENNFGASLLNHQYENTYLTQNQNYDTFQNLDSTPTYSNNAFDFQTTNNYIQTDNLGYNIGDTNNFNFESNLGNNIDYGKNTFRMKIRKNDNFDISGFEQNEFKYRSSQPLPSFDSNQLLNNQNSSNQYVETYGLTSVELPISTTPTLPISSYTNEQLTNDLISNNQFEVENTNQFNNDYTTNNQLFTQNNIENNYENENYNQYFTENASLNQYPSEDIYSNTFNSNDIISTNQYLTYGTEGISGIPTDQYVSNDISQFNNDLTNNYNINQTIQTQIVENYNHPYEITTSASRSYNYAQTKSANPFSISFLKNEEKSSDLDAFHSQRNPQIENIFEYKPTKRVEQRIALSAIPQKVKFNLTLFQSKNDENEKINKLEGETNQLKSGYQDLDNKINFLSNELNSYNPEIDFSEKEKTQKEVNDLRAENQAIKQQLLELNNLRDKAAELDSLRRQLAELDPLKKKAEEMDYLKSQLKEFNYLRSKLAELNTLNSQLGELDQLRAQVNQMNALQEQLGELNTLRIKARDTARLKDKLKLMEYERMKYEKEIQNLRKSQKQELLEMRKTLERSIYEEERTKKITAQGDIIHNVKELEMITRNINKLNKKITLNLIYKATLDGDKASSFHERCDNAQSTLVLVETDKGMRFGGFTTCSWSGDGIDKKDEDAFIFSLDKMLIYENIPGEDAIGCYPRFGPTFLGCQIRIYDDAFTRGGTTYERGLNYYTEEDFELTGGDRAFGVKEIEVYEVIVN